ncbi:hypothetical protein NFI96_007645 [Prochilodus magdalenae]|nr:hypothetical protein NFI96_007645 [Prochilodus magdalenae]
MKMSWMGLVLGLVLLMVVSSDARLERPSEHPVNCCFKFARFKIPESEILEIVRTDSNCPVPGYVSTIRPPELSEINVPRDFKIVLLRENPVRTIVYNAVSFLEQNYIQSLLSHQLKHLSPLPTIPRFVHVQSGDLKT